MIFAALAYAADRDELAFEGAPAEADLHPRHFAVLRGLKGGEVLGIPAGRTVGLFDELVKRGFVARRGSGADRWVELVLLREARRAEGIWLLRPGPGRSRR